LQLIRTARGLRLWTGVLISPAGSEGLAAFPDVTSAPVVARASNGAPIVAAGNAGGAYAAFEGASGRRLWQRELGSLAPAWADDTSLYLATTEPRLMRLDVMTGETLWSATLDGYEDPEDREDPITWSGPVLAGGRLLVGASDGRLVAFDPQTGATLGETEAPGGASAGAAAAGGTIFVLTDAGDLLAFR
ncbi:MAG: PQQ-binding-like beta-propeller repeat protein, partial [Pseudomonadota bacterium]